MSDNPNQENSSCYWRQQVDAWKATNLSQNKFCQTNDLIYHRFVYWRRKFEKASQPPPLAERESGGFATVNVRPDVDATLSLCLPNGLVVRGIRIDNITLVRHLLEQL